MTAMNTVVYPDTTLTLPEAMPLDAVYRSYTYSRLSPLPESIGDDQLYYWSAKWQADQAESEAELAAGKGLTFDNADDAIRWLFSVDPAE